MKKLTATLLATGVIAAISFTTLAPAAFAHERGSDRGGGRGDHMRQGMQQRGGMPGGFIRLMCTENGAARLEAVLGNFGDNLNLDDSQKVLLEELKTAALSAQTEFADNCALPAEAGTQPTDPVERLKTHQTNMSAYVDAMDQVIPAFETFYDSLSDEQKAQLQQGARQHRMGKRGSGPQVQQPESSTPPAAESSNS